MSSLEPEGSTGHAAQGLRGEEMREVRVGDEVEVTRLRPAIGSYSKLGITLAYSAVAVAVTVPALLVAYLRGQA